MDDFREIVDRLYTLHRYWLWANRLKSFSERYHSEAEAKAKGHISSINFVSGHCFMFMAYWFATLFVVVEGYQELGIGYDPLDTLLSDTDGLKLLPRFRNGIFHFQVKYLDPHVTDLLAESERLLPWIHQLHAAFSEFFLDIFGRVPRLRNQVDTMTTAILSRTKELEAEGGDIE